MSAHACYHFSGGPMDGGVLPFPMGEPCAELVCQWRWSPNQAFLFRYAHNPLVLAGACPVESVPVFHRVDLIDLAGPNVPVTGDPTWPVYRLEYAGGISIQEYQEIIKRRQNPNYGA